MVASLDVEIGRRLRQARLAQNFTQKQVAYAAGISAQAYQKYELGHSRLSLSTLAKIKSLLVVQLDDLLPLTRPDGTAVNSPTAAIGSSITGLRMAQVFASLAADQQRAILEVAVLMRPAPTA